MSIQNPEEIIRIFGDKYTALAIANWCGSNGMVRDIDYSWYMVNNSTIVFQFKTREIASEVKGIWQPINY